LPGSDEANGEARHPSLLRSPHVGNRGQLLAAIVEHVLGEMNVEDPRSIGWKEWLRHASGEYRRVVHAHPHLAPVLVSQLVVNAPATRLVETVLAVLDGAGFRGQDLAPATGVAPHLDGDRCLALTPGSPGRSRSLVR
jgi:TetR/AcrR family transcriptional regulator, tetracycline repressor protein